MLLLIPEIANLRKIFGADSSWITPYADTLSGKFLARCSFHKRASLPAVRLNENTRTVGFSMEDPGSVRGRFVTVRPENAGKTDPICSGAGSGWPACSDSAEVRSPIATAMHLEKRFICLNLSSFITLRAQIFRAGLTALLSGLRLVKNDVRRFTPAKTWHAIENEGESMKRITAKIASAEELPLSSS